MKCKYCPREVGETESENWAHDACVNTFFKRRGASWCVVCGVKHGTLKTNSLFCEDHNENSTYIGY